MGRNKLFLIFFLFVILFLQFSFVEGKTLVSDANVSYDSEILESFDVSECIDVIIDLKNISEKDNLFFDFSEDEIKSFSEWDYSNRIDAQVTKKGFEKLLNDSRVKSIYYDFPVQASDKNVGIGLPPISNQNNGNLNNKILLALFIFLLVFLVLFLIKLGRRYFAHNKKR